MCTRPKTQLRRLICLTVALIGFSTSAVVALDSISQRALSGYDSIVASFSNIDAKKNSTDGGVLGQEGFLLRAYLSRYEATGDITYMEKVKARADLVFANRSDRLGLTDQLRNKTMKAWVTNTNADTKGLYYAWLWDAGRITYPIARWCYLVKRDAQLRARWDAVADGLIAEIAEVLSDFDEAGDDAIHGHPDLPPGNGTGTADELYYDIDEIHESLGDGDPANSPAPYNQSLSPAQTYLQLWLATGEQLYRTRAAGLARFFKNRLEYDPEETHMYYWRYRSYSWTPTEDFSHAADIVDFAVQCYRAGIVFGSTDMERFAELFRRMDKGAGEEHCRELGTPQGLGFCDHVDGSEFAGDYSDQAARWMQLASVDPSLRSVYSLYFDTQMANYSSSWSRSKKYRFMLGAAKLIETEPPPGSASLVSEFDSQTGVPSSIGSSASFWVTLRFRNSGTVQWNPSGSEAVQLRSQAPANNSTWGTYWILLPEPVPPGGTVEIEMGLTAPATPGSYSFQWQLFKKGEQVFFGQKSEARTIVVGGAPLASQFREQIDVPCSIGTSVGFTATLSFKNTGIEEWSATGTEAVQLRSQNPANNSTWGTYWIPLPEPVPPGGTVEIEMDLTAPATPGNHSFEWQLFKKGQGFFGQKSEVRTIVVGSPLASEFMWQTGVPSSIRTSATFTAELTFKNTGMQDWSASGTEAVQLRSQNPPHNSTWGRYYQVLGASVSSCGTVTLSIPLTAPATPGTYNFEWQLYKKGVGLFFGDRSPATTISVVP